MADWTAWGIPVIVIVSILLLVIILLFVFRWYVVRPMYDGEHKMDDKTVVITGANTGIGKETARDLSKRGARIVILCRNTEKGRDAANEISNETGNFVGVQELDLTSLESVRKCAENLKQNEPKIHVLINNAGVMTTPQWETKDGFEMQLGTNHIGHFLLTLLLADPIKAASPSRIVNVSSLGHMQGVMNFDDLNLTKNYSPIAAYAQSKLANILFTRSLAKKLDGSGVTSYALHPGVVKTELARHMGETFGGVISSIAKAGSNWFAKTPLQGAQTSIYCAVDPLLEKESGMYYSGCAKKTPSRRARNAEDAERLWNWSLNSVGLPEDFKF